jgi:hypothetical protein
MGMNDRPRVRATVPRPSSYHSGGETSAILETLAREAVERRLNHDSGISRQDKRPAELAKPKSGGDEGMASGNAPKNGGWSNGIVISSGTLLLLILVMVICLVALNLMTLSMMREMVQILMKKNDG